MIEEKDILRKTHSGLHIYAHILGSYYPDAVVLQYVGKQCKITRNPFNRNKCTLDIRLQDWVFYFQDTELPDFKGNPFDFAALHFQLKGQELLQKINEKLHLHLAKEKNVYDKDQSIVPEPETLLAMPRFSFFRSPVTNTQPNAEISILDAYKVIKGSWYQVRTSALRSIKEVEKACKYKRTNFDYVTFSGVFSRRGEAALITHSGLLTLDFDHVTDLLELKDTLLADPYFETELMFVSPSGNGLKWIIAIDLKKGTHQEWFSGVSFYLKKRYALEVDTSGKDISRACFLPHDPEVWIHPLYLL